MGLILTRSPFHVSRGALDANALLTVQVGLMDDGNVEIAETYDLNFRNNLFIDISNLCSVAYEKNYSYVTSVGGYVSSDSKIYETGYITVTLSGSIDGVEQDSQVTNYYCTDGYVYSSERFDKILMMN